MGSISSQNLHQNLHQREAEISLHLQSEPANILEVLRSNSTVRGSKALLSFSLVAATDLEIWYLKADADYLRFRECELGIFPGSRKKRDLLRRQQLSLQWQRGTS